jgi:hypothetical protein
MKFKVTIIVAHYFYFGHLTFKSTIPPKKKNIQLGANFDLKRLIYI